MSNETKTNKLPESPSDMPWELHGDEHWLRNLIVTLDDFDCVDIHYERDHATSNATGEACGDWEVAIETSRKRFSAKHEEITNALWCVTELARAADTKDYEQRLKAREDALAKLSDDERRILGLFK